MNRFSPVLILLITPVLAAAENTPRVVVLANADDAESVELAGHYMAARHIPGERLVTLPLPADEEIDWETFVTRIRNPLLLDLVRHGLLTGEQTSEKDAEGRIRFITKDKAFDHLVICKGVPLKIRNDGVRFEAREKHLPLPPPLCVNQAAVDSELALLPKSATPLAGLVRNPRHGVPRPAASLTLDTLMVARLDGPTYGDARHLVDSALEAEKNGLMGRAYVDMGGPHRAGDEKLAMTADLLRKIHWDTDTDTAPTLFAQGCRFDAPAFYFGWYSGAPSGALADPRVRFAPGAVAMHIHSYSASTLRDAHSGWAGPLVARGAALTVGNVYEPYLEFSHSPALLLHGLLLGMNAGEAAAYANPALSWQSVMIGDPLYRPFAHDVDAQVADFNHAVRAEHAYTLLRVAARLDAEGKSADADALLTAAAPRLPVLAFASGRLDRAIKANKHPSFKTADLVAMPEDAGLVLSTAEKLAGCGLASEALRLLAAQHALGVKFDERAAALARAHGDPALAAKIAPPPPPPPPTPAASQNQKNSASPKAAG